jgi:hypothetical protein
MSSVISEARSHVLVAVVIAAALCCPESSAQTGYIATQQLVNDTQSDVYEPQDKIRVKGQYRFTNTTGATVLFQAQARIENEEGDPLTDWGTVQIQVAALSTHTGGWIVSPEEELSEAPDWTYRGRLTISQFNENTQTWAVVTDEVLQFWLLER